MAENPKDKDLDEASRIMGRLVKMPPAPHEKRDKPKGESKPKKEKPAK